ncbi:MAG: PD-(D/E)XK nuclease family protein [Anaeromyxobacteraceae bacterium]
MRGDDAERADLRAALDAAIAGLEGEGRAGDPAAWTGRREVLAARLERHLEAEAEAADALVPVAVEHRFGGRRPGAGPERAPLELTAGGVTVRLEGRIDRVDASPGRLRVVDYKGGKSDGRVDHGALLDPETWGESSFQVPTYLLAAARDFPGRAALEARYAFLRSADAKGEAYEVREGAPAGAEAFAGKVVGLVGRIRAGAFPQVPGGCETCPWPAVCRPERTAAPPAEGPGEGP